MENRPENVAVVRAALSGVFEAAELEEELATDIRTAVSEACNNVVLHAYEGERGRMRVAISCRTDRLDIVVTDNGTGIRKVASTSDHMGLGLALISALADQAEFMAAPEGGTEVRMRFGHGAYDPESDFPRGQEWPERPEALVREDIVMWCEPIPLVRHLTGRVARAAVAGSHFTMAGASDLYAINDAIASFVEVAGDGHLVVGVSTSPHRLTLGAGPVAWSNEAREAGAPWFVGSTAELRERQAALAELVDQLSVEPVDQGHWLHLLVSDRGREPDPTPVAT